LIHHTTGLQRYLLSVQHLKDRPHYLDIEATLRCLS
jgi:hypothetical protein